MPAATNRQHAKHRQQWRAGGAAASGTRHGSAADEFRHGCFEVRWPPAYDFCHSLKRGDCRKTARVPRVDGSKRRKSLPSVRVSPRKMRAPGSGS
jgi:hypothetical protein